ncbi:MAG: hypothetical protein PVH61_13440 [Candidatus Aminicenantes bacterium]|jgi:hypothetical protein
MEVENKMMDILQNLSQADMIIIVLIFLVLVVQIILFLLLKKRIKTGLERLENELKKSTRSEINRLKGEIPASEYRPEPEEEKTEYDHEVKLSHRDENNGLKIERTEKSESTSHGYTQEPEQLDEEKRTYTPPPEPERIDYQPQDNWNQQELEPAPAKEIETAEPSREEHPPVEQSLDPWVKEYNLALNSEASQNSFLDKYRPDRVDVINALERRRRANIEPVYQTAYNGDYYVIEVQEMGQTLYAVLPRFDLIIKESNYKAGAFSEVFECLHYENDSLHRVKKIFESAFFTKKRHENWELLSRGKIELDFEE